MVHLKKKTVFLIIIICTVPFLSILFFIPQNSRKLTAFEVLNYLPATIEVFVYHDIDAYKQFFSPQIIFEMFFLSEQIPINSLQGIVLSDEGTFIVLDGAVYKNGSLMEKQTPSMTDKIGNLTRTFFGDITPIHTLGFADNHSTKINSSSFLCVSVNENGIGNAQAIFSVLPSTKNYDLLETIGVFYHGYTKIGEYYHLNFTNDIQTHVEAGQLMNFTHTQMCIEFFINGAELAPNSEVSLRKVIRSRAEVSALLGANYLSDRIMRDDLSISPIIAKNISMGTYTYFGNVAPYGIVAKALAQWHLNYSLLQAWLIDHQQYGLWGYHSGFVNTSVVTSGTNDTAEVDAIDSCLVFEGLFNASSIQLLDMYRRPSGGFLAQLNDTEGPYSMNSSAQIWFWCQEDYGVTASAYYFLNNISLSNSSTLEYLKNNFHERASMWLANPYYIEYLTARALKNQSGTDSYLQNITQKIVNETNPDGTWGHFDKALSTALAVLTLKELNYTGIELDRGLFNLMKMQQSEGYWSGSNIFFSALDRGASALNSSIEINGAYFDYILYEDINPIITSSYCVLALSNNSPYYSILPETPSLGNPFINISSYIEYVLRVYVE